MCFIQTFVPKKFLGLGFGFGYKYSKDLLVETATINIELSEIITTILNKKRPKTIFEKVQIIGNKVISSSENQDRKFETPTGNNIYFNICERYANKMKNKLKEKDYECFKKNKERLL